MNSILSYRDPEAQGHDIIALADQADRNVLPGLPRHLVLFGSRQKMHDGSWMVTVPCPCGQRHTHGLGGDGDSWGHRVAHCTDASLLSSGYIIAPTATRTGEPRLAWLLPGDGAGVIAWFGLEVGHGLISPGWVWRSPTRGRQIVPPPSVMIVDPRGYSRRLLTSLRRSARALQIQTRRGHGH